MVSIRLFSEIDIAEQSTELGGNTGAASGLVTGQETSPSDQVMNNALRHKIQVPVVESVLK